MSKFNYLGILKYEDLKSIKDDIDFEIEVEAHNEDLINNYLEHVRGLNRTDFKRFLCDLLEVPYPTDTKVIENVNYTHLKEGAWHSPADGACRLAC